MSVFKDDMTTYTGNVTVLGSLNVSGGLTVTGALAAGSITVGGNPIVAAAPITNSLSGNVALNNTGLNFDGPSIAQGTSGTWFASGSITVQDTAGAAQIRAFLWDGSSVIASGVVTTSAALAVGVIALSGYLAAPVGNIRISARDVTSTSGLILFNQSGASKDATVSAVRIG